jgi:hypothetical protein
VIAGGIWLELSDEPLPAGEWQRGHPRLGLGPEHVVDSFAYNGVACEVRRSPEPMPLLKQKALLCAQPIVAFALRLDGDEVASVAFTLSMRERRGRTTCFWRNSLGVELGRFDEMPKLDELRASFVRYVDDVLARRRQRGR